MRWILLIALLALMPLASASTTTFDLGNYTVGMDYMPLDTKYLHTDGPNGTIHGVRWSWGSFDPGAWAEISLIEINRPWYNLSDLNMSVFAMVSTMRGAVFRATDDQMLNDSSVVVVENPYLGLVASGYLNESGESLNAYTTPVDAYTAISVVSNGNDNVFANVLRGLVITKKEDVPAMRANSIAERLRL